ncbi:MAG: hypothetical protein ACP5D3_02110, partial [Sulfurovum sp.]
MKHLCCSRFLILFFLFITTIHGALSDKSAIMYMGKKISYPMVGIHDYIIVDPAKTNVYTHGFQVYNDKIYARVAIGKNSDLKQLLLDLEKLQKQGFGNFFFDVKKLKNNRSLLPFFKKFHLNQRFLNAKVILHLDDQETLKKLNPYIDTLLLYNGSKDPHIHTKIKFYKTLKDDIIAVETNPLVSVQTVADLGMIPYIASAGFKNYGNSSKQPVKREIFTLIDEQNADRMESLAHQYGALPLEYLGFIQKLHNIYDGLPDPDEMQQYAGVVVWLTVDYTKPAELISWVKELTKRGVPIVFAGSFGFDTSRFFLQQLGINSYDGTLKAAKEIIHKDPMLDYEINTPTSHSNFYYKAPKGSKNLLTLRDAKGITTTTAAITPWGGYAIDDSFMMEIDKENIWVIDPFKFFKEALRLKKFPVPDPTTENGSRLFFTHIDGDGIAYKVEYNPELVSGDIIYSEILKKYKFPHSVSIIGAEVLPNGLYPKESQRFLDISAKMYALENVEPATHTFSHPFYWGEIKNGNLVEKYRLKLPDYNFSLDYELSGMLDYINDNLLSKNGNKKAQTVYWTGDCAPRENALAYIYKHKILAINGGDTTISKTHPWLTCIAPFGLKRGEYYQIYAGAQNENVFTHNWLGPYWGFKRVTQTFELTNS